MESHDKSIAPAAIASLDAAKPAPEIKDDGGCAVRERIAPQAATAPGGAAAPLLDIGCGNVPQTTGKKPWSRKQWTTRRTVLDRLNYWMANGYQCLWVTLTSSPSSPLSRLRKDLQTLRKRMARHLDYERVHYVCVDTREGHGVLHIIFAWKEADE